MRKILITEREGKIITALFEDNKLLELFSEEMDNPDAAGNIYLGRVLKVVSNIEAAFVEYRPGKNGYLSMLGPGPRPKTGEELPVIIEREAVKTKEPVLSRNLSFPGRLLVLTTEKANIGFSSRITDREKKEKIREILKTAEKNFKNPEDAGSFGWIVRTNAGSCSPDDILEEADRLYREARTLLDEVPHRTLYTRLKKGPSYYLQVLRDAPSDLEEVVTDLAGIHEELREKFPSFREKIRLYEDRMVSLYSVYRLEHELSRALSRRVLLKSGAYLVFDYTEAMTVIDVNSGKYSAKKKLSDAIFRINTEAAAEIARQLRLRNLSGIILVDFIDMESEEDRKALMDALRKETAKDPVKTAVVDMTSLGLVEITRKKVRKPLHEII